MTTSTTLAATTTPTTTSTPTVAAPTTAVGGPQFQSNLKSSSSTQSFPSTFSVPLLPLPVPVPLPIPCSSSSPPPPSTFEFLCCNSYSTLSTSSTHLRSKSRIKPKSRHSSDAFDSSRCACQPPSASASSLAASASSSSSSSSSIPSCCIDERCFNVALRTECIDCRCGSLCQNRRFQLARYVPHRVGYVGEKGYGLISTSKVTKNTFIVEYVGEVVSVNEMRKRMQCDYASNTHFYLLQLDSEWVVDATRKGNHSRFINHSCEPNCRAELWTVAGKQRMGIFADREIGAEEEFTFDYKFARFGAGKKTCLCGSTKCRGFLSKEQKEPHQQQQEQESEQEKQEEREERNGKEGEESEEGEQKKDEVESDKVALKERKRVDWKQHHLDCIEKLKGNPEKRGEKRSLDSSSPASSSPPALPLSSSSLSSLAPLPNLVNPAWLPRNVLQGKAFTAQQLQEIMKITRERNENKKTKHSNSNSGNGNGNGNEKAKRISTRIAK